ncbi:aldo/keto reductase [Rhodospirillum rubrum]|uniref:Aldo/keto reductase n=1 Tax=Rhodospirillum rubrum (strain ATCC 11170 / ATH 1.1.1 / DSM 467 / LMG 4362 / NCIMB 8255 / S1) TaxID=269796 RepID=Q2RNF0_RHORT|nr:aldo/keto reductase [Rhodospirillum rubrum]ABC24345.1 Aldo/keto reductase [Rhodospirillum rubrum ATCC 11170]AEO50096.1 aldo/keto reductase [Rhodospirillum rubrum F11]MBK5956065.1 oxidoreductase [Rhodospirillum rubrum]QXG80272.1 aldo/keto reductase [Rhodospirillum rubrum]HAP99972.1 oxidoreductase [Rhodospirillum rubrum]
MIFPNASQSGSFLIGGDLPVNRLGFGAMRVTGPGVWGAGPQPVEALKTLKMLPEVGVTLIDTADSYGPGISEAMIAEALYPYEGANADLVIATKGGLVRPAPDVWIPLGRPEYLRQQAQVSRRTLKVEKIGLWQLHRIDPKVPRDEQFDAIKSLIDDGIIAHAGLSEVTIADIEEASDYFPVATVQNRYNMLDRASEPVLEYCEAKGIGFIPWSPLGAGGLFDAGSELAVLAKRWSITPGQIALAWLLKRSPVILPIPGTSKRAHLQENIAAAAIVLTDDDFSAFDQLARDYARKIAQTA